MGRARVTDVDACGNSALHVAAAHVNTSALVRLVQAGAYPDGLNEQERSPLDVVGRPDLLGEGYAELRSENGPRDARKADEARAGLNTALAEQRAVSEATAAESRGRIFKGYVR